MNNEEYMKSKTTKNELKNAGMGENERANERTSE